jgi:hypothetical protein
MPVRLCLAALLACLTAHAGYAQPSPADPFGGLNLLLTADRLAAIHDAVRRGHPLMTQACDQVIADAAGYMRRDPDPIAGVLKIPGFYTDRREEMRATTRRVRGDAYAAHCLALAYALTGEDRYADRAEGYIFAWVDALTGAEDDAPWYDLLNARGDTPLVIAYSFPGFIYAHDILRGLGRIDADEQTRFATWLRRFVDYHHREESFKNNHHAWQMLFLAVSAHAMGDRELFAQTVQRYRDAFHEQIGSDGSMWRELVRGEKAATYTLMALEGMVQFIHIAERHGYTDLRDMVAMSPTADPASDSIAPVRRLPKGDGHVIIRRAIDHLLAFVDDPDSWSKHRLLTMTDQINRPTSRSQWGYLFEVPRAWWGQAYAPYTEDAPYGLAPPRCYTLSYSTLYFRKITWPGDSVGDP